MAPQSRQNRSNTRNEPDSPIGSQPANDTLSGAPSFCATCSKQVYDKGSFTAWLFQSTSCECASGGASPRVDLSLPTSSKTVRTKPSDVNLGHRFEVLEEIGDGGMGIVYKAKDTQSGDVLAIKLLKDDVAKEELAVKRLKKEALVTSGLSHKNLISVHGYSETPDGEPYLVMEYIDGHSLADLIAVRGRLDLPEALEIGLQICQGISHAHRQHVLHRDLKPSNVLIAKSSAGRDHIKIADFGLTKSWGAVDKETKLTRTGEVCGSPLYMSPEQCQGEETDTTTDIYSIGCILFEMLTGRPPFEAENSVKVIVQHVTADREQLVPILEQYDVPARLIDVIITGCLNRDKMQRFQRVEELSQALWETAANQAEEQPLQSVSEKQKRPWLAIGVLTVVGLVGTTVIVLNYVNSSATSINGNGRILDSMSGPSVMNGAGREVMSTPPLANGTSSGAMSSVLTDRSRNVSTPPPFMNGGMSPQAFGTGGSRDVSPSFANSGNGNAPPPSFVNDGNRNVPPSFVNGGNSTVPPPFVNGGNRNVPPPFMNGGNRNVPPPFMNGENRSVPPSFMSGENRNVPQPFMNSGNRTAPQTLANAGNRDAFVAPALPEVNDRRNDVPAVPQSVDHGENAGIISDTRSLPQIQNETARSSNVPQERRPSTPPSAQANAIRPTSTNSSQQTSQPQTSGGSSPALFLLVNFKGIDKNRNGTLDNFELPHAGNLFTSIDSNNDARLGRMELEKAVKNERLGPPERAKASTQQRPMRGVKLRLAKVEQLGQLWKSHRQALEQMDLNHNKQIEHNEFPYNQQRFRQLDRNEDSVISAEESQYDISEAVKKKLLADFQDLDTDRNSILEPKELFHSAVGTGVFNMFDRDRDNRLTLEELR